MRVYVCVMMHMTHIQEVNVASHGVFLNLRQAEADNERVSGYVDRFHRKSVFAFERGTRY